MQNLDRSTSAVEMTWHLSSCASYKMERLKQCESSGGVFAQSVMVIFLNIYAVDAIALSS